METVSLLRYANDRENVVLFWASVGTPMGDYSPLGYQNIEFADRRGLLELEGEVRDGDWLWNGEGDPSDDFANDITKLQAYVDPKRWASIVNYYEASGN